MRGIQENERNWKAVLRCRVTKELKAAVRKIAENRQEKESVIVREAVTQYLKREGVVPPVPPPPGETNSKPEPEPPSLKAAGRKSRPKPSSLS